MAKMQVAIASFDVASRIFGRTAFRVSTSTSENSSWLQAKVVGKVKRLEGNHQREGEVPRDWILPGAR
jgi:hypothetical protein